MPIQHCILNGILIELSNAYISPLDRGFMYGDGIFDTMFAPCGVPFLFDEHIQRLYENLKEIGISMSYTADRMFELICSLIEKNGLAGTDATIRTTVTRGLNSGKMFYQSDEPTLFITANPVPKNVEEARENGLRCVISTTQRAVGSPLHKIKSLNFLWSVMGAKEASLASAEECIFFNTDGCLTEGTRSNIFIIKEDKVFTPPVEAGLLPGVTRGYLIKLLHKKNIKVTEKNITKEELFGADEVFITSSVSGVVPVNSIDEDTFKKELTLNIQEIYFNSIGIVAFHQ